MMVYTHSYQDHRGVYTHVFYSICDKKVAILDTYNPAFDNPVFDGYIQEYRYLPIYEDNNIYRCFFKITLDELDIKGKRYGSFHDIANLALSIIEKKIFENI